MTGASKAGRRQPARAARQALRLCEAEAFTLTCGAPGPRTVHLRAQPRTSTARAALLAVGLPPPIAVALRRRLRLLPDREDRP